MQIIFKKDQNNSNTVKFEHYEFGLREIIGINPPEVFTGLYLKVEALFNKYSAELQSSGINARYKQSPGRIQEFFELPYETRKTRLMNWIRYSQSLMQKFNCVGNDQCITLYRQMALLLNSQMKFDADCKEISIKGKLLKGFKLTRLEEANADNEGPRTFSNTKEEV